MTDASVPPGAVVVGYDGSADADLALAWAAAAARDRRRPLHALISEVDQAQILEIDVAWHAERIRGLETDIVERLKDSGVEATHEIARVPPVPALIDASEEASMIVLGARGHSRLSGLVLGSTSQHVARHAHCPVVVARRPHDPRANRVVVGVDGSGGSREAVEFAFDHAERTSAALTVAHAWDNLSRGGAVSMGWDSDRFSEERDVGERIIAESIAGLAEKHPDVPVTKEAIPVPPARTLADASQSASLVVVGSRGRGAFAGLLLGTVSQSVLSRAQCPVAVVR